MNSVFFIKTLKKELKSSGVTYKELAKTLKLSEAGIKKLLNKQDLSMGRANQICSAIGVSLYDILRASEESVISEKKFTEQQSQFLLENLNYFNFYMRLAYEQKTPEEIQIERGLSNKSVFKYLKKLDDLKLIKLLPDNRASFPEGIVARVNTANTKLENLKYHLTIELIKRVEKTKQGLTFGGIFFLSKDEHMSLERDFKSVHEKYSKLSLSNRSLNKIKTLSDHSTGTAMITLAPYSLFDKISNID